MPIERDLTQLRQCLESVRCEISIETNNVSCNDLINAQNIFSYNRILPNNILMHSYRTLTVENYKRFVSSKQTSTILWFDNRKQLHHMDQQFRDHMLTCLCTDLSIIFRFFLNYQFSYVLVPLMVTNPSLTASTMAQNQQPGIKDVDVVDIKWCSTLESFFILLQRHLFLYEPKTNKFTQIHLTRHKDYP